MARRKRNQPKAETHQNDTKEADVDKVQEAEDIKAEPPSDLPEAGAETQDSPKASGPSEANAPEPAPTDEPEKPATEASDTPPLAPEIVQEDHASMAETMSEEDVQKSQKSLSEFEKDDEKAFDEETRLDDKDTASDEPLRKAAQIETAQEAALRAPAPPAAKSGSGVMPAIFGGVLAACIGFAGAQFIKPEGWPFPGAGSEQITSLKTQIAEMQNALRDRDANIALLQGQLDQATQDEIARAEEAAGARAALSQSLNQEIAQTRQDLGDNLIAGQEAQTALLDGVQNSLSNAQGAIVDLGARLSELEKRPVVDAVSPDVIAVYERELMALQDAMRNQRTEIDRFIAETRQSFDEQMLAQRQEVADLLAQAQQAEISANQIARTSNQKALALRIKSAVESGAPYVEALDALAETGTTPADILVELAAEGAPQTAQILSEFPNIARVSLNASRGDSDAEQGSAAGIGDFLAAQFGLRSVVPREGDAADAVLSRIEAASKAQDWPLVLAEIETLPAPAREAIAPWAAQVQNRLDAIAAAEALVLGTEQ